MEVRTYNEHSIFECLQNNGSVETLKAIIQSNPRLLTIQNYDKFTVLMQAIVSANMVFINTIIEYFKIYHSDTYRELLREELDKYNDANCSTLMAGAKTGKIDIIKRTIEIYEEAYGVKLDENIESFDETKKRNQQKLKNIIAKALETLNNDECNVLMQVVKKGDGVELNELKELLNS
jgi:hypothetical protein